MIACVLSDFLVQAIAGIASGGIVVFLTGVVLFFRQQCRLKKQFDALYECITEQGRIDYEKRAVDVKIARDSLEHFLKAWSSTLVPFFPFPSYQLKSAFEEFFKDFDLNYAGLVNQIAEPIGEYGGAAIECQQNTGYWLFLKKCADKIKIQLDDLKPDDFI